METQQHQGSGGLIFGAFCLLLLGLGWFFVPYLLFGYRKPHNAMAEARTAVGTMNRAQQAHMLELGVFAMEMNDLRTGINPETEHYVYQTQVLNEFAVQNNGVAKRKGLQHTIGLVWRIDELGTKGTNYQLCYSTQPTETALEPQPSLLATVLNWFQSQKSIVIPEGTVPTFDDIPTSPLAPNVIIPCPNGYTSLR